MRKILVASLVSKLSMLVVASSASASSIITMGAPDQTPSIMNAGETDAATLEIAADAVTADDSEILVIGKSVVAVGPDALPPSREEVGAIAEAADEAQPEAEWLATDAPLPLRSSD